MAARDAVPEAGRAGGGVGLGARQRERLEAVATPVAFGRQEAVDATTHVAEARGAEGEGEQDHRRGGDQPPAGHAGARERRERHRERDGGRGEVRLGDQHQRRQQGEGERERAPGESARAARVAGGDASAVSPGRDQQAGGPDQKRRRAARKRAQAQPAARAGGAHADARHEHRGGREQRCDEQRRRQTEDPVDAGARGHAAQRRAQRRADHLPDGEVAGPAEAGRARVRAGGEHDREAERGQPHRGRDQESAGSGPTRHQKCTSRPAPASKRSPNNEYFMASSVTKVGRVNGWV